MAILGSALCLAAQTHALTYQWTSRSGESGFRLDVPESWRKRESPRRNGIIVQFRQGTAHIEVRSVSARGSYGAQQIINQKAARLSAEYTYVRYVGEKPSRHPTELTLNVWEIQSGGTTFIEESAVYLAPEGPVVVSCRVRHDERQKYRTHCENAYYSLTLTGSPGEKPSAVDIAQDAEKTQPAPAGVTPKPIPAQAPPVAPAVQKQKPTPKYDENYLLPTAEDR